MAQLPYYALTQGSLDMQRPQEVVDEYAPLREGLNQAQKYFEQKEAVEASKILSKARSDWSIKMNEMQQQAGLDYEGFSEKVNQGLQDYENEIINSVPFSQREKFSADFAGIKYDMLNKAGAYEITASAEKIKLDMDEIATNSANAILSDPSQYETVLEAFNDTVDGLQVADSVKVGLKKEGAGTLAVAQINALTNINPNYLLSQLKGGYYDSVIDSKQKAAAMNQATNKIKSNANEVKTKMLQMANETYRNDLLRIYADDNLKDLDLENMIENPVYASSPDKIKKLKDAFYKRIDDKHNDMQTVIALGEGRMINPDASQKKALDYAYDRLSNELPDFNSKVKAVETYVQQSNGYLPSGFAGEIYKMSNSSSPDERKIAYNTFYELRRQHPNLSSSIGKEKGDEFFIRGAALNAGMELADIEKRISAQYDTNTESTRKKALGKIENKFDLDSDSEDAKLEAERIFDATYMMTGDEKVSKEFAENTVNASYGDTMVGTGAVLGVFARSKPMYLPPEKLYGRPGESAIETAKWQRDELKMDLAKEYPDIDYKNVILDQAIFYTSDGKRQYMVTDDKGNFLMYWYPDYLEYQKKKKEIDIEEEKNKIGITRDILLGE